MLHDPLELFNGYEYYMSNLMIRANWRHCAPLLFGLATLCWARSNPACAQAIDRRALVERHNMQFDRYLPQAPASLGNGEFAFNFDITGLQTFPSNQPGTVPLTTMGQWGWHSFAESQGFRYEESLRDYNVHGRQVSYATDMQSEAALALRANPHRFNLARVALRLMHQDNTRAKIEDLVDIKQTVFLWSGEAVSQFTFENQPVRVRTVVHPKQDTLAVSIDSPLVAKGQIAVEVSFAYPTGVWGPQVDDWNLPDKHQTACADNEGSITLSRTLDDTRYRVEILSSGALKQAAMPHTYAIGKTSDGSLEVVLHFSRDSEQQPPIPDVTEVRSESAEHWADFWSSGGAIDLSGSRDPRWHELERRIVLSQFLTASHCAGTLPPQETGLVCNSWFGKSHLEMHWWHAAHFPLWGRVKLLERSLAWYQKILPSAKNIARRQGYAGVRWPKMTGPAGISSPSEVGELLIWQQPHPIYFAELVYRAQPNREVLERYREIVEQTAQFMADYAYFDNDTQRYVLGPVLIPAQECYDGRTPPGVLNPTFELTYWRWGLETANLWRERRGLEADPHWTDVAQRIAKPHVHEGTYSAIESPPFLRRRDHPSMLAAWGVLPDVGLVNPAIMQRTFQNVVDNWHWDETWGWDFPMMAMTAARLGNREQAVDLLLFDTPKNKYLPNGHCRQEDRLPVYLPANGGLLTAAAMMAAGWDGVESADQAPGFPNDGSWTVKHEGLQSMP